MTQTDKQAHIPGPWDPLPDGYWVRLGKVRPTDTGYYYLMVPVGSSGIMPYCHSVSGRFKPETVAKSFGPRARNHAESEANKRRRYAETKACEGLSVEALEAGVVADLLEACEELLATGGISTTGNAYLPSPKVISRARIAVAKAKGETPFPVPEEVDLD